MTYDYGTEVVLQVYGQTDPPEYKVANVKVPVATYRGENDYLTAKEVGKNWYHNMVVIAKKEFLYFRTIRAC